jgi:hypothetical protein
MTTEAVVSDNSIGTVVPGLPMGYDEAVREAFRQRGAGGARYRRSEPQ